MPLLVLLALCFFCRGAEAQYGGGTGVPNDPYLIYTAEQMNAIGEKRSDWDKHFKLMADIDVSNYDGKDGRPSFNIIAPDTDNTNWQFRGTPFTGVFDGNGHTISHLTITGASYLGLFGKLLSGAEVKNLGLVDVNITGSGGYVGGLVGENRGAVTRCFSTGAVSGYWHVGGLVGSSADTVTQCYSSATVSGNRYVGGLVGNSFGYCHVTHCYSTGGVGGVRDVGGLVGSGCAKAQCFWDIESSGQATSPGGTGRTTAQMQDIQTYLDAGWDWVGETKNGTAEVWQMPEGGGYPTLAIFGGYSPPQLPQLPGLGTPEEPFQIESADQLLLVHKYSLLRDKHFVLNADIDLDPSLPGRRVFGRAVIPTFGGSFVGNGHVIHNLQIEGTDVLGLFGKLTESSVVKDLGLENVSVYGTGSNVGGLVGDNSGHVLNCYSTGGISGVERVGGMVGYNGGTISNCYSMGSVAGASRYDAGGLVGQNGGTITDCYAKGGSVTGMMYVGGLVGVNGGGTVTNSFWDIETSGQAISAGGTGKTTAEMQTARTFIGWGCEPVWTIEEGKDYPRLWWENMAGEPITTLHYGGGCGTQGDPYLIYTAEQMNTVGANPNDWDKHFKLMADIDLSSYTGTAFNIIGIDWDNPFAGVFDGNGHTISNFGYTSADTDYIGLFGYVGTWAKHAVIKDFGLIAPNINAGTGDRVGSLAGRLLYGTITNCYVEGGSVSGNDNVGGLVGLNDDTITNCYATGGSVSGNERVGGLVGWNWGSTITNCYARGGSVSGNERVGGLVGSNTPWWDYWEYWSGTISNSYSTGSVAGTTDVGGLVGYNDGTVMDSFWDIQTSGQETSAGGTGKTTAEMQIASTFIAWGTCGNEGTWTINEGVDYPRLDWENMPGEVITKPSYGGGSGTEEDPYLIYTAEELNTIGLIPCDKDKHFKLMADIDLSSYTGTAFNIIRDFTGVFDGSGRTISNFSYTSTDIDDIGLFGYVYSVNAEIKDLGLIDPNVDAGTGGRVGSLVGYLSRGNVTGCYVEGGSVSGNERVGGLVGFNYRGTITDCSATGDVSGDWYVGGLVGYNRETITDCYATGSVLGDRYVGSLVGFNDDTIINCSATGIVSGDRYVGGQVGANEGSIANCYATSSVSGMTAIGGLVGYNRDTISNCYAAGNVTGYSYAGGLVGYNRETITNSYAMGIVTGDRYVGGFVGDNLVGRITDSFWDIETSGQTLGVGLGSDDGISGKNMAEMQTLSTFIDAGWDFVGESVNGTEDFWCICEGVDYPRLTWEFVIGDFDGDYDTDFVDFSIFAARWLQTDSNFFCGDGGTDLTNDGKVDFNDLKKFADNWLGGASN